MTEADLRAFGKRLFDAGFEYVFRRAATFAADSRRGGAGARTQCRT